MLKKELLELIDTRLATAHRRMKYAQEHNTKRYLQERSVWCELLTLEMQANMSVKEYAKRLAKVREENK